MVVPAVFTEFSLVVQRTIIGDILEGLMTGSGGNLSRREIARQLSAGGTKINESTLRTAFRGGTSTASQRTIDRIAQAITDTQILVKRTVEKGKRNITRDTGIHPAWPDFYRTRPPAGANRYRAVGIDRTDAEYEFQTITPVLPAALPVEEWLAELPDSWELDSVIWDVE